MTGKHPEKFQTASDTYTAIGVIGQGACGCVFAVRDGDGSELALKCLRPDLADTEKRKRFKNELDFCRQNRHTNILTVIDSGVVEWDGHATVFYVMPLYGDTLRSLIQKGIESKAVLPLFAQLLDGLEAAHFENVVHRDLKPENILYDGASRRLVIADFGIARFEQEDLLTAVETKAGDRLANFQYAAPEQKIRGATIDQRADIYAMGLILNEMFTGEVIVGSDPKKVRDVSPEHAYLDDIVETMRRQAPMARPANVAAVKEILIGHRNAFIAEQRYDELRGRTVKASDPIGFEPIRMVGRDFQDNHLIYELDRAPDSTWIDLFRNPSENSGGILGYSHDNFTFKDRCARIRVHDHVIKDIDKTWFPKYLESANRQYRRHIEEQAKRLDYERRTQLEAETRAAERRAQILRDLEDPAPPR